MLKKLSTIVFTILFTSVAQCSLDKSEINAILDYHLSGITEEIIEQELSKLAEKAYNNIVNGDGLDPFNSCYALAAKELQKIALIKTLENNKDDEPKESFEGTVNVLRIPYANIKDVFKAVARCIYQKKQQSIYK